MKQTFICMAALLMLSWQACNNAGSRYVDVNTGKALNLKKDPKTGLMVNKETGKPASIYVDKQSGDTIYGRTGKVINGRISKKEGRYVYLDDEENRGSSVSASGGNNNIEVKRTEDEVKIKSGDYKKEVEKDGDVTIKTIKNGDTKIKVDGETGERKVKKDN